MNGIIRQVFRRSSAVEQVAVNDKVAGSNPAAGAKMNFHYKEPSFRMVLLVSTSIDRRLMKSSKVQFEEAREILGDGINAELDDEQLQNLILDLEVLARMVIQHIIDGKLRS